MKRRSSIKRRIGLSFLVLLLIGIVGFFMLAGRYLPFFYHLAVPTKHTVVTTKAGQINILLLGIGGGNHEGPDLTDTIIFASINPNTKKTTLISIPRDLWIPEIHGKINTAYTIGEDKKKGDGLVLTKAVVGKLLNQPVQYGVRIDFSGFEKAVDLIGGLNITVDNTFDDYQYPIAGKETDLCGKTQDEVDQEATSSANLTENELYPCRYEHLHFDKGPQVMDGATALKYVRSRHAIGPEGTDFARSKRQEKVITAFKDKLFSAGTLLNPAKILSLYTVLQSSIDTDISQDEMAQFVQMGQKLKEGKITSYVIDYGDESTGRLGLLYNPPLDQSAAYGNAWVLIPRIGNGNYTEIQQYASCVIKSGNCTIKPLTSDTLTIAPSP